MLIAMFPFQYQLVMLNKFRLKTIFVLRSSASSYAISGIEPALVFDFTNEYYRTGGAQTTFDSALTATRAGNATMVDSDGKIKWAPHNLLTYSEQFDNAAWVKSGVTVTANAAVAPDGNTTADLLTVDTTTASHSINTPTSSAGIGQHTQAYFIKDNGANFVQISWGSGSNPNSAYVNFDLLTGSVGTSSFAVGVVTALTNGWYHVSATVELDTVTAQSTLAVVQSASSVRLPSFTGDGTSGIYIWGAHLYRSDLGGMVAVPADARATPSATTYVPTTSAARYLPRRGHHVYNGSEWVNEGLLVESEARTNLVPYSNDFTQWTNNLSTDSIDQGVSGPNGVAGVTKLTPNAGSPTATPSVYILPSTTLEVRTFQVFMKAAEYTKGAIRIGGTALDADPIGVFDLSAGSVMLTQGIGVTARIQPFGNGWYRCSLTYNNGTQSSGTGRAYIPNIIPLSNTYTVGVDGIDVVADGTSGIYIYGAQLEAGSTPSSYIPTAGATVTRAAETLVIPSANLPWPAPVVIGEELVTNGTFDTDYTGWADVNVIANAGAVSVSSGQVTVTRGTARAEFYQIVTTEVGKVYDFNGSVISKTGTVSIWVGTTRNNASNLNKSGVPVGLASGQFVATATATYVTLAVDGAEGVNGVFDNISVREINPLAVSIAMDGRMTYADTNNINESVFVRWTLDSSNEIQSRLRSDIGTGELQTFQRALGVTDAVAGTTSYFSPGINVPFNIASRHGSTFINGAVDGVALTADLTPVALPDLSATNLQLGYDFMGTIGSFRVWADDIGDAGIAEASV